MNMDNHINPPNIRKVSENLFLITLEPGIRGFQNFIGVWLYTGNINFIVDVGPSSTAPGLITALENMKIAHLDYILLTHIHIDHAGGIGQISDHFDKTPIVCHSSGIGHLMDPSRLWEATTRTLGPVAQAYGPITGVDKRRFLNAESFAVEQLKTILTPGHSPHHVSFKVSPFLFAGEAGGVFLSLSADHHYLRPATPPRFFLETTVKSIDALLESEPEMICYSHFGIKDDAMVMLLKHKKQLYLWEKIIGGEMESSPKKDFISDCLNLLLQNDPNLAGFFALDDATQERERGFLNNSIRGFVGYLESLTDNS
jgi:glyoxylase-like metal-dependent hydrolase (beta-lactamase superfamily II)